MWLATTFPSNSAAFRSYFAPSPSPSHPFSLSVTCNSRKDGNVVDPPELSPARRKERRGRETVRRIVEGGRKGRGGLVGGMESISKLQATLFDPLSPPPTLRSPTPSRGLFPAPSLRKSHSPYSTHTPPVSLSISLARSLSGDSVLASNTDIEQSPFSLKPSSHQE